MTALLYITNLKVILIYIGKKRFNTDNDGIQQHEPVGNAGSSDVSQASRCACLHC